MNSNDFSRELARRIAGAFNGVDLTHSDINELADALATKEAGTAR